VLPARGLPALRISRAAGGRYSTKVLLIMLDTIRRIVGGDAKPIEIWLLIIEVLVLLLILAEFVWKIIDWCKERRRLKEKAEELRQRLATLSPSDATALEKCVLEGEPLTEEIAASLNREPPLTERDHLLGWRIVREHRDFLKKWATTRTKKNR
jgi:hypothetical protein